MLRLNPKLQDSKCAMQNSNFYLSIDFVLCYSALSNKLQHHFYFFPLHKPYPSIHQDSTLTRTAHIKQFFLNACLQLKDRPCLDLKLQHIGYKLILAFLPSIWPQFNKVTSLPKILKPCLRKFSKLTSRNLQFTSAQFLYFLSE